MVSHKQLEANRRNALKSTGPKTAKGKATVARNALKHGLCSGLKVLPGLEQQEQWDGHVAHTWAALRPVGYIEEMLAERIALLLWRLGRVARFEREAAATAYEGSERELARDELAWGRENSRRESPIDGRARHVEWARERCDHVERLWDLPPDEPIQEGYSIVEQAIRAARIQEATFEHMHPEVLEDGKLPDDGWTAAMVCEAVECASRDAKREPRALLQGAIRDARKELAEAERELRALQSELDKRRRRLILAPEKDLVNISRYESHLERALYKALHELRLLQGARLGAAAAPVDVDVKDTEPGT